MRQLELEVLAPFGLLQSLEVARQVLLGQVLPGDVAAFDEDAGDRAVGGHDRLIDKIDENIFQRRQRIALQLDGHSARDVRLAACMDMVEQLVETLAN